MPTVNIWMPDKEHTYGHVSIETKRYYMSFWPRGDIKADRDVLQAATVGVDAGIVYHRDRDYHLEGKRLPERVVLERVPDEALDRVYQEFLKHNGVDPDDVTVEAAERVIQTLLRTGDQGDRLEKDLQRTLYTYLPTRLPYDAFGPFRKAFDSVTSLFGLKYLSSHREECFPIPPHWIKFYSEPQSCTSFVLNLIGSVVDDSAVENVRDLVLTVPKFRDALVQYYVNEPAQADCNIFWRPLQPGHRKLEPWGPLCVSFAVTSENEIQYFDVGKSFTGTWKYLLVLWGSSSH